MGRDADQDCEVDAERERDTNREQDEEAGAFVETGDTCQPVTQLLNPGGMWLAQKQGTAMGASFAPTYANLYMGCWEQEVAWSDDNDSYMDKVVLWVRYIDDLFIMWDGSEQSLLD
ncbi:hypothetical protein NDU88_005920 [Pleurodeles waltl]|uniref:Reverse transcriptase domain-containing protein n=1 Tax=Pleurodeles waltl TaxID=8319 RepID=A0AAV7VPY4_PLEWA|nr:hypothetical protein NDU88_005920 [Pleurodeles waltl]